MPRGAGCYSLLYCHNFSETDRELPMYDLVVIGGGSGGLGVATAAAKVGAKVALIEKDRLGGEATFAACLPSKSLTHAAKLVRQIGDADRYGVRAGTVAVDFAAVLGRVRSVAEEFARSESVEVLEAKGIEVIHGSAAFEAYDTVLVDGTTRVPGQRFVIATGSRPAVPDIPGLAEAGYLDSHSLWSLTKVPVSLIVIGPEPIGVELAQVFSRFGAKVTVLTASSRLLSEHDGEASDLVTQLLTAEGLTIKTGVEVTKVEVRDGIKVCKFQDPVSGGSGEVEGSEILLAAGRWANVESLNLEAVGVHADPRTASELMSIFRLIRRGSTRSVTSYNGIRTPILPSVKRLSRFRMPCCGSERKWITPGSPGPRSSTPRLPPSGSRKPKPRRFGAPFASTGSHSPRSIALESMDAPTESRRLLQPHRAKSLARQW